MLPSPAQPGKIDEQRRRYADKIVDTTGKYQQTVKGRVKSSTPLQECICTK